MKKLFTVQVAWECVVYATDKKNAEQVALDEISSLVIDNDPQVKAKPYSENESWFDDCKPYGTHLTIGELKAN